MVIMLHIVTIGIFYRPNYDTMCQRVHNSDDLNYYIDTYIEYKDDYVYEDMGVNCTALEFIDCQWLPANLVWERGKDDCEGYAVLVYEVLSKIGYDCEIIDLYDHVVCKFEKKDKINGDDVGFFSSGALYKGTYSIEDIADAYDVEEYGIFDWKEVRNDMLNIGLGDTRF